ncbi:glutaredoxin domain-containing protein [Micromonospora sp. URMC 103]|uniref:glutaredoxin domain-containing protein n=1 Tax=Micromonospora sp. URMC 103 TaxID=3423406 RepID=UPI003F1E2229
MLRNWWLAGLMLLCGVFLLFAQTRPGLGAVWLVIFAVLALLVSPVAFPRSVTAEQAQARSASDGRPVVYWRPGCPYCIRLRLRLGLGARRAYWVNIWRDPAGAAAVRAVTGGDETVPTVTAGGESAVNPAPEWVRQRLTR